MLITIHVFLEVNCFGTLPSTQAALVPILVGVGGGGEGDSWRAYYQVSGYI